MGSCVSRSGAMPAAAEFVPAPTAKVVDLDGSMAQFSAPVTAREALAATAAGGSSASSTSSSSRFLCCSDELDFDAPVRALAARDALQAGQLYFALPASMLGRPLSASDMAALAVKACAALGAAPVVAAGTPSRDRSGAGTASAKQHRRRQNTGRVSPFVVVSAHADGEWESYGMHDGGYGVASKAAHAIGPSARPGKLSAVTRISLLVLHRCRG